MIGSLLAQGTAQLVGTGLGLLIQRPVIASMATIVLPLGLWGLFQTTDALQQVGSWTTPYPSAQHLLSGEMTPTAWAQWLVVLAIWGLGLNSLGIAQGVSEGNLAVEPPSLIARPEELDTRPELRRPLKLRNAAAPSTLDAAAAAAAAPAVASCQAAAAARDHQLVGTTPAVDHHEADQTAGAPRQAEGQEGFQVCLGSRVEFDR